MSGIRPTEMTIRDLLQEELRQRGVTVIPEFSVSTPVGRMMPDMLLKNGAQYVVETKLGAEVRVYYSRFASRKVALAVTQLKVKWKYKQLEVPNGMYYG